MTHIKLISLYLFSLVFLIFFAISPISLAATKTATPEPAKPTQKILLPIPSGLPGFPFDKTNISGQELSDSKKTTGSGSVLTDQGGKTCGTTLVSNTFLATDIVCQTSNNGLILGADNITLDCNGYRIHGFDGKNYGVLVNHRKGVTIRDCVVDNFKYGVLINDGSTINLDTVSAFANTYGFGFSDSNGVTLTKTGAVENSYGSYIRNTVVKITDSVFSRNKNYGIYGDDTVKQLSIGNTQACGNKYSDIFASNEEIVGDKNTCSNTCNWNDSSASACSNTCAPITTTYDSSQSETAQANNAVSSNNLTAQLQANSKTIFASFMALLATFVFFYLWRRKVQPGGALLVALFIIFVGITPFLKISFFGAKAGEPGGIPDLPPGDLVCPAFGPKLVFEKEKFSAYMDGLVAAMPLEGKESTPIERAKSKSTLENEDFNISASVNLNDPLVQKTILGNVKQMFGKEWDISKLDVGDIKLPVVNDTRKILLFQQFETTLSGQKVPVEDGYIFLKIGEADMFADTMSDHYVAEIERQNPAVSPQLAIAKLNPTSLVNSSSKLVYKRDNRGEYALSYKISYSPNFDSITEDNGITDPLSNQIVYVNATTGEVMAEDTDLRFLAPSTGGPGFNVNPIRDPIIHPGNQSVQEICWNQQKAGDERDPRSGGYTNVMYAQSSIFCNTFDYACLYQRTVILLTELKNAEIEVKPGTLGQPPSGQFYRAANDHGGRSDPVNSSRITGGAIDPYKCVTKPELAVSNYRHELAQTNVYNNLIGRKNYQPFSLLYNAARSALGANIKFTAYVFKTRTEVKLACGDNRGACMKPPTNPGDPYQLYFHQELGLDTEAVLHEYAHALINAANPMFDKAKDIYEARVLEEGIAIYYALTTTLFEKRSTTTYVPVCNGITASQDWALWRNYVLSTGGSMMDPEYIFNPCHQLPLGSPEHSACLHDNRLDTASGNDALACMTNGFYPSAIRTVTIQPDDYTDAQALGEYGHSRFGDEVIQIPADLNIKQFQTGDELDYQRDAAKVAGLLLRYEKYLREQAKPPGTAGFVIKTPTPMLYKAVSEAITDLAEPLAMNDQYYPLIHRYYTLLYDRLKAVPVAERKVEEDTTLPPELRIGRYIYTWQELDGFVEEFKNIVYRDTSLGLVAGNSVQMEQSSLIKWNKTCIPGYLKPNYTLTLPWFGSMNDDISEVTIDFINAADGGVMDSHTFAIHEGMSNNPTQVSEYIAVNFDRGANIRLTIKDSENKSESFVVKNPRSSDGSTPAYFTPVSPYSCTDVSFAVGQTDSENKFRDTGNEDAPLYKALLSTSDIPVQDFKFRLLELMPQSVEAGFDGFINLILTSSSSQGGVAAFRPNNGMANALVAVGGPGGLPNPSIAKFTYPRCKQYKDISLEASLELNDEAINCMELFWPEKIKPPVCDVYANDKDKLPKDLQKKYNQKIERLIDKHKDNPSYIIADDSDFRTPREFLIDEGRLPSSCYTWKELIVSVGDIFALPDPVKNPLEFAAMMVGPEIMVEKFFTKAGGATLTRIAEREFEANLNKGVTVAEEIAAQAVVKAAEKRVLQEAELMKSATIETIKKLREMILIETQNLAKLHVERKQFRVNWKDAASVNEFQTFLRKLTIKEELLDNLKGSLLHQIDIARSAPIDIDSRILYQILPELNGSSYPAKKMLQTSDAGVESQLVLRQRAKDPFRYLNLPDPDKDPTVAIEALSKVAMDHLPPSWPVAAPGSTFYRYVSKEEADKIIQGRIAKSDRLELGGMDITANALENLAGSAGAHAQTSAYSPFMSSTFDYNLAADRLNNFMKIGSTERTHLFTLKDKRGRFIKNIVNDHQEEYEWLVPGGILPDEVVEIIEWKTKKVIYP